MSATPHFMRSRETLGVTCEGRVSLLNLCTSSFELLVVQYEGSMDSVVSHLYTSTNLSKFSSSFENSHSSSCSTERDSCSQTTKSSSAKANVYILFWLGK